MFNTGSRYKNMHDEIFQEDMSCATKRERNTKELLIRLHNGDDGALDDIVEDNLPLVRSVVKHFLNRGCEYDDLLQIGAVGLIKAARNYDFSFNVKFSTYAVPLIGGEIKRFLRDDGIIKISRSVKENSFVVSKAREKLERKYGREPTVRELGIECKLNEDDVIQAIDAGHSVISIYENNSDDDIMLVDRLEDEDIPSKNELKLLISELLGFLDENDRKIIILRYFKDMTQSQVANVTGLSQVQVSRREKKILSILREKAG